MGWSTLGVRAFKRRWVQGFERKRGRRIGLPGIIILKDKMKNT